MLLASPRWAACALALLALIPTTARAQSAGFAINRFDPAERGSDWFAADLSVITSAWAVIEPAIAATPRPVHNLGIRFIALVLLLLLCLMAD